MRGAGRQVSEGSGGAGKGPAHQDLGVESDGTLVEVAVHAQAVGHGAVQHFDLVGVLGGEAGLQPVVDVQAPGRSRLAQLLESAQAAVGHTQAKGLAVWFKAHLPVVLAAVNQRVPCSAEPGRGRDGACAPPELLLWITPVSLLRPCPQLPSPLHLPSLPSTV